MATVRIFDKITGDLLETHKGIPNLKSWLVETVPNYYDTVRPPYSAELNGKFWPYDRHDRTLIDSDVIDITCEPRGAGALWAITLISAAYSFYVASNLPDFQGSSTSGQSIYAPNARANSILPSGVIRQSAGQQQIFPDILSLHRKYENDKEYLNMLLSVGAGNYAVEEGNIYVSNTPLVEYRGDNTITITEPGGSLSTVSEAENWYTSPEVDGQELNSTENSVVPSSAGWTYDVSGATITSYLNAVATTFPFVVGEIFYISTAASPNKLIFLEVDTITGASNEIATLKEVSRTNPTFYIDGRQMITTIYNQLGAASLSTETGAALDLTTDNRRAPYGPYKATPNGEPSQYYELDFFFPSGLSAYSDKGNPFDRTIILSVQYRLVGGSTWTQLDLADTTFTEQTKDQFGRTVEIDTGASGEYEFRVSAAGGPSGATDASYTELVQLKRLKAKLDTPASYEGITTIALSIEGNSSFAKSSENKINLRGHTRKLPTVAELEANSWDLSDSTTQVSGAFEVPDAEFVASTSYTDIGVYPELVTPTIMGVSFSEDGLHMVTHDNDGVKFFDLTVAFRPDQGQVFTGYLTPSTNLGAGGVSRYNSFGDYVIRLNEDGSGNAVLQEVTLSSAYDGSTASTGVSFTTGAEVVGSATSMDIDANDGKTIWISDGTEQKVLQYSTAIGFDMSGLSYDSVSFNASSILGDNSVDAEKDLKGISITKYASGVYSKLILMRRDGVIFPCTLSTPGDITTAVYDGSPFTYSAGGTPQHLIVNALDMFIPTIDTGVGFVTTYRFPEFTDNRASRSAMRFIGLMLREVLGDDATTKIDWTTLDTMNTLLESRGDYFDGEFTDETTYWDMIKVVTAATMTEPTVKEGKFVPIRHDDSLDAVHLYTPDIMTGEGLQIDHEFYDAQEPDGVDVEYFDSSTNAMEVIECRLTGDLGLRAKRIQLIGVSTATRAWRAGMRELRRIRLKPATYTFTTEMDALNSEYGDIIAVASEIFASQCGNIVSASGTTVTLDFEPDFNGAANAYTAYRDAEGAYEGIYIVEPGASANQVELRDVGSLAFTPITDGSGDPSFMTFGSSDEWGKRAIIRNIEPSGDNMVSVTAEEYLTAIYTDDGNAPS